MADSFPPGSPSWSFLSCELSVPWSGWWGVYRGLGLGALQAGYTSLISSKCLTEDGHPLRKAIMLWYSDLTLLLRLGSGEPVL